MGCGNDDACIAELATVQYSIDASSITYNQLLLASGDCTLWVIIDKTTVGLITNGEFPFIRSSEGDYECSNGTEITDTLYSSSLMGFEDQSPFYCIDNMMNCPLADELFYAGGSFIFNTGAIETRNGMNVWIRDFNVNNFSMTIYYILIYIRVC